jgi:hypothetical protein
MPPRPAARRGRSPTVPSPCHSEHDATGSPRSATDTHGPLTRRRPITGARQHEWSGWGRRFDSGGGSTQALTSGNAAASPSGAVVADHIRSGMGMRRVSAPIALLSSNVGRGGSAMARCWAGRIVVTQHITGPRLMRVASAFAVGGRVIPTRAWLLVGPLGWTKGVTGDRLVASWTVARGSERPGPFALLGGVKRPRRGGVLRAIDASARPRVLGGPAVRAACGGNLRPLWLPRRVVPPDRALRRPADTPPLVRAGVASLRLAGQARLRPSSCWMRSNLAGAG